MRQVLIDKRTQEPEFERRLAERRRKRLGAIAPEARAYLALAPIWTRELAERCDFIMASEWEGFQKQAQGMGLLEIVDTFTAGGEPSLQFWMPDAMRPIVLSELRNEPGRQFLHQMAFEAGDRIAAEAERGVFVPPATLRWAVLARGVDAKRADTTAAARELSKLVNGLLDQDSTDQALDWLSSGEALARALLGRLEDNVILGRRRVELAYRRALDERYLARFVPRERQIQAFKDLVAGAGGHWALHYLGMGGVGKTMLLRYIDHYGPGRDDGARVPTCRIDFDYLSPDYPVLRPAQLLLALAQDLRRLFTTSEQEDKYVRFREQVRSFHETLGGGPPPERPLALLEDPRFKRIVTDFADLLGLMPKPVVLILDTCEELIKSQYGDELPHVEATFRILKWVHDEMPEMRVVFSGRRLLARGGDGWTVTLNELPDAKSYLLEPVPSLRLYLMRGFDDGEANRLFDKYSRDQVEMPADIREAILQVSPELGTPARIYAADGRPLTLTPDLFLRLCQVLESSPAFDQPGGLVRLFEDDRLHGWQDQAPAAGSFCELARSTLYLLLHERTDEGQNALVLLLRVLASQTSPDEATRDDLDQLAADLAHHLRRHNPYTIDLYGAWYRDDPDLTADTIESGKVDPYIEMRIVNRITEEHVLALLPAVVGLRHFDEEMLRPAFNGGKDAFADVFKALSDQEWMRYGRDPGSGQIMLQVDRNLHPLLLQYYEKTAPEALAAARARLGPPLAQMVRDTPLRELGLVPLNAALSLLPDREATQLWSEVELAIGQEYDWASAQRITRFLRGADVGAAGKAFSLLQAAVLATQTAAHLQQSLTFDASDGWKAVARTLEQLDPALAASPSGRWLAQRATLGQIAATRVSGRPVSEEQKDTLDSILMEDITGSTEGLHPAQTEQRVASLLGAYEALLDQAERTDERVLLDYLALNVLAAGRKALDPHSFAQALAARAALQWTVAEEEVVEMFELAEARASLVEDDWRDRRKPWADWQAPTSLRDRIRLEMLRLLPGPAPLEWLSQWLDEAAKPPSRIRQIDSERLLSAILQRFLDIGPVPYSTLERLTKQTGYLGDRRPVCAAHQETPPLFVTLAQGWLALGDVARAQEILAHHLEAGIMAADDPSTVGWAIRGQLAIARRMRQRDLARSLRRALREAKLPDEESWPAAVLSSELRPKDLPSPASDWSLQRLHAWWRCQYDLTPHRLSWSRPIEAIVGARMHDSLPRPEKLALLALALDEEERAQVAGERLLWQEASWATLIKWFLQTQEGYRDRMRRAHAEASVQLFLRAIALKSRISGPRLWAAELIDSGVVNLDETIPEDVLPEDLLRRLNLGPVGKRRAAEIALEEGELLALRLPLQGARLLCQALQWLEEVDDTLGATQAGILATSALLRSGQGEAARQTLDDTRACYERVRGLDLPEWSRLETLVSEFVAEEADELNRHPWGGWLLRLLACLNWRAAEGVEGDLEGFVALEEWLRSRFDESLVPELRVSALEEVHAELGPEPEPGCTKISCRALVLTIGFVVLLGVGILSIAGLVVYTRFLAPSTSPTVVAAATATGTVTATSTAMPMSTATSTPTITPPLPATGWIIGLYVLVGLLSIPAIYVLARLVSRFRAWLVQKMEVSLRITSPFGATTQPLGLATVRETPVAFRLHQGSRWDLRRWPPPFFYRTEPREVHHTGHATLVQAYAQAAEGIGDELSVELGRLQALSARHPLPVSLEVDEMLVAYPWEAMLTLTLLEVERSTWREALQFYRTTDRGPGNHEAWLGDVQILAGETWAGLLEQSWAPLQTNATVADGVRGLWEVEAIKVLHVVGRPIQTSAGLRLQVGMGEYKMSKSFAGDADGRGGKLIDAWDLPLDRTWLVVIQAVPVEGLMRYEADREDAAYLRALADDIFQTGVQAVITLPALPPGLCREVLGRLAKELRQRAPLDRKRMLRAAASVRKVIGHQRYRRITPGGEETARAGLDHSGDDLEETLVEMALDVCVFWRPRTGQPRSIGRFEISGLRGERRQKGVSS